MNRWINSEIKISHYLCDIKAHVFWYSIYIYPAGLLRKLEIKYTKYLAQCLTHSRYLINGGFYYYYLINTSRPSLSPHAHHATSVFRKMRPSEGISGTCALSLTFSYRREKPIRAIPCILGAELVNCFLSTHIHRYQCDHHLCSNPVLGPQHLQQAAWQEFTSPRVFDCQTRRKP